MIRSALRKASTSTKLGLAVEKSTAMMEGLEGRQLMSTTTFVSDLTPTSATNGWGSYEKNMSNGEKAAGDGRTLNIAGQTFAKGLGTNAASTITYNLNGKDDQFLSSVGVDNEVGKRGSVVFQAYLDGRKVYDSSKMVGGQKAKSVSLNTTGKNQLKLVVTDAGNGTDYDHADWANARLVSNSTTTPTDPTTPPTQPAGDTPIAPTDLAATAYNTAQVNLSWKDNSNIETGYKVERSTDGTNFTQVATTGADVTGYQDKGLAKGTKYTYRVRATNAAGNSAYTNAAAATTPTADTPIAPTTLTASAASSSAVNVAWKDNSNIETGYKVERSTDGTNFTQVGLTGANVTTFKDTGLAAGTKYTYRVRATNAAGNSAYTNTAAATTSTGTTTPTDPTTPPPATGGKPTADNTGPTNASILKSSGSINVTQNGAVIENVSVNGMITVNASNVTIRNFKIAAGGNNYGIQIGANAQNVTIEDGEITGSSGAAIYGPNFTARRLEIHHTGADGIKPWSNVVIDSSYIHHLGMNAGSHADGIQESGGDNLTITNNNIDMPEHTEGGQTYLSNATIFLSGAFGPINNVKISGNWLNGGNYTVYSIDPKLGTGAPTNVSFTNNKFGRNYTYGIRSINGTVTWTGNTWADTGAAIP